MSAALLDPLSLPYVQRGIFEILALAVAAGLVGTWIVMRGLAFYTHAAGAAAFPGLVLADGLAFSAPLGATLSALTLGSMLIWLGKHEHSGRDGLVGLLLVGLLALGIILASDVFQSRASVDSLLFGSLLTIDNSDLIWAAATSIATVLLAIAFGRRWTAIGFDRSAAAAAQLRPGLTDALLLGLITLAVIATLPAIGALLSTALLVVPAATTRMLTDRLVSWRIATLLLVSVLGSFGLLLSVQLNAPPGTTIAVLAGAVFVLIAVVRSTPMLLARARQ